MPGVSGSSRMFTDAELIDALRRRRVRSLRPDRAPGEFPPGWRAWFAALREQAGVITGATADAIVAIFVARELRRAPPRAPALSDWQAFTTLWRQEWQPASDDDRAQRIAAMTITLLVQLLFAIMVLWLTAAHWGGTPPARGEDVVQVVYIGEGTPVEQGGGAPTGPAPEPAAAAPAAPAGSAAAAPASSAPATRAPARPAVAAAPSQPAPAPSPAAPAEAEIEAMPAPQPLQVTEVAVPDSDFALQVPELAAQVQAIEIVELPSTRQREVEAPVAQVRVPDLQATPQALPTPAPPLPDAQARTVASRQAQVRVPGLEAQLESLPGPLSPAPGQARQAVSTRSAEVRVPGLATGVAALPMPSGSGSGSASSTGSATGANASGSDNGSTAGAAPGQAGGQSSVAGGVQGALAGAGAGPKPGEAAGAFGSARPGSDWGIGDRAQPGGQAGASSGLFDGTGRVKLPPGAADGGDLLGPDGVLDTEIADLDRAGTWLKRVPMDYTPTRFDKYWMPGGTLLEEWVRRGVREVSIRIPGSSKRIHCVVSLLQLGGGCGINDPNMQDQEATARAAPEIPWKPELQEDQGSL